MIVKVKADVKRSDPPVPGTGERALQIDVPNWINSANKWVQGVATLLI